MKSPFFLLIAICSAICLPTWGAHPADENPVIELAAVLSPGQSCTLHSEKSLPIYDTRAAKRTLARLLPGRPIHILAIDRYGLKVRGLGKNGPLIGWIGQKTALGNDRAKLKTLAALYERHILIEQFIAQKRPAVGMTLRELTRIYGPTSSHNIVAEGTKRTETAVWVVNQKVNLNDTLDLGTDAALLKLEVETGRVTVNLIDGVAHTIDVNLEGVAADIPTVPKRIAPPFKISPANPLTTTEGP